MKTTCPVLPEIPAERFSGRNSASIRKFREMVLTYYAAHGRDLAWRRTTDPYRILVSEIMLQQTQVERVTLRFPAFLDAFPDFPSLADAPLPAVLAAWQGMGYNRRAISLQQCARRVVEEYGGVMPQDPAVLSTFPGIGTATAGSICAFAFNMPVVFIETNIRRVFIHFFFDAQIIVHDDEILPLVRRTLYKKDPRTWYWALMDLGSDLKKTIPNPNRRSTGYLRQPAFAGSDRELRGKILKELLKSAGTDMTELIRSTGGECERVQRLVSLLEKEGFLTSDGERVTISSR